MEGDTRCEKCGAEAPNGAVYCPNCGSRILRVPSGSNWDWNWKISSQKEPDWWGLILAAGFLIVFFITITTFPDVFTKLTNYFESFETFGHAVLPPYALGQIMIFFFNLCGIWGLVAAALRFGLTGSGSRALSDGVGALFSLYTAEILIQFYAGTIRGTELVGLWIVGLFFLIVASALITLFVPRKISFYARHSSEEIPV